MMRFMDQIAIVTGGAGGLGKSIAQRLAEEGSTVIIFDLKESPVKSVVSELRGKNLQVDSHLVDITEESSVVEGFKKVADKYGQLDILVNCAGIIGPNGMKIAEVETAAFDDTLAVNLRGSFLMTKYALIEMEKRNYGRILLVASISGKEGNAGMSAYSTSKAGVIGLVKAVGKEYAETGITVNGLAPAVIWTTLIENMEPEQAKYMTDRIPMKRCGTLEEVASMVAFIVSKEASFNTGSIFDLSGGRSTY
jgi:NAD(P)-dependent dehydrogenase (short-subunit alcohol dehydrogenase family)